MSSKAPFDDWSREEKEEFANQRMNKMRELNEKLMKRYQEVNQDRMDFERDNPFAQVLASKKNVQREGNEMLPKPIEKRSEREWDAGKTSDGDWASDQQDFRYSRPNRRVGYDDRRNQRDHNWRNADSERRDNSYGFNKRPGNSRGMRNQDSNVRNTFHSQNANNYRRPSGRYPNRTNNSFNRDFKNWNNDPKKQFSTTAEDPVWRNDELNEARNKQSRVENWVQSVSTEVWSDSDEIPYSKKQSNSKTKTVKYDKKHEEQSSKNQYKNFNQGSNQEKSHKSSTSDSSYKEDVRQRYDRFQTDRHASNSKESDQRNYTREKFKKQFSNRSTEYRNKASTSISTKQRDYGDNMSWNNHARENKTFQNNKSGGNWIDKTDSGTKTGWGGTVTDKEGIDASKTQGKSGTWSDQEDNDQIGGTSKNIASDWDQQVSNSSKWENSEAGVQKNSQRHNNSSYQKYSERTSSYESNQRHEQTSLRFKNDQKTSWRDSGRNQNQNFRKPNKVSPWKVDLNHMNNQPLGDSAVTGNRKATLDKNTKTGWGDTITDVERSAVSKTTGGGGTWSDQEDKDQVDDVSKHFTSGWDQQASNSANWENPESTLQNNGQRHNNSCYGNNQKFSEKTNNSKPNQWSEQKSSGNWSDQEDFEREKERNQNKKLNLNTDAQWGVESDHVNSQSLCSAFEKENVYEKNEMEGRDLSSGSDIRCASKNKQLDPDKAYVQMCNVQKCDLPTYENEANSVAILINQQDCDYNNEKSPERINVQDQIEVQVSVQSNVPDNSVEGSKIEEYTLQKSPSQKIYSLVRPKSEIFELENQADKITSKDSSENMVCEDKGKNFVTSDEKESDLTHCSFKENELSRKTFFDLPPNYKSLTAENVSVPGETMEDTQSEDCQLEHLNEFSSDTLSISIPKNEQRKVQLVNTDMKDKVSTGTSRDFSNSIDLLEESAVHGQSIEADHSAEIISSTSVFESSGNAEHQPKDIEGFSNENELNCPRPSESSIELETNPGALTITDDNDVDNDWSTITDDNESDCDEGDIVNNDNINN